jgi:Asp-tRNA(Asn)/Glu-tRNA(Gln) amidotransferase A subunit family amidase
MWAKQESFKQDLASTMDGTAYIELANRCDLPVLSTLMHFTMAGLRLGLEIMAAPFLGRLTLRVSKAYDYATD